jgi:CobQ-like glutamine amidotransferase family enzyme
MISLGVLFPKHLNLNGDLGNLEVLSKQLDWRGLGCEIVEIESADDLSGNLDFILVGHGSTAAWASIGSRFQALAPALRDLVNAGTPGMSVSTGFERFVECNVLSNLEVARLPVRSSKFVVHNDGDNEVLGYLNTDAKLPVIYREANWISTMLHGPVLAKNPVLLDEILASIAAHAGVSLPAIRKSDKAGLLADLIDEIWKLESDLASE